MLKLAFSGVQDAVSSLRQRTGMLDEKAMQANAVRALKPVVRDARSLAPVDEGTLRDSIDVLILDDGSVAVVIQDFKGLFFELGTVKMRAQPMLAPAIAANQALVFDVLGGEIGKVLRG